MDDDEKIKRNFEKFKDYIESCLLEKDIIFYMVPLKTLFSEKDRKFIEESPSNEKVNNFIKFFNRLQDSSKYSQFKNAVVVNNSNQWIHTFLTVDINDHVACIELENKWKVLQNTLNLLEKYIESIHFDENFVHYLYSQEVISKAHKEYILSTIKNNGPSTAIRELFNVVSMKSLNWYGHLLYIIHKQNCDFIYIFSTELGPMENCSDDEKLQKCFDYANDYIQKQIPPVETPKSNKNDDANFDLSMDCNEISGSVETDDVTRTTNEKDSATYELRKFQLELCEKAMDNKNVIIYAPTGSGKTNIAVYITNHHLKNNLNGKVAFLVHRIPLVIQQFGVFQKYKNPEFNVVSIRGKSDDNSGPLISHLKDNNIFVMTSDILLNALTIDDGNKIESISEFSLIIFDECHNCTNSHPYTRIMKQYFIEKKKNSNKLPQIIGLTASPKSNKKDDNKGITESLFQLCACLNCFEISKVTENKMELEGFISQPEQEPHLTAKRSTDEFETVLLEQIGYCEQKFKKMKNENYFSFNAFREIPDDKFHESYANFVGSLKLLATVTIDENDGKQKTYSIYKFLNAFYRGLIVNQMFDKQYAMKTIESHLSHDGVHFTCCFEEEFYKNYDENIRKRQHEQSDNPAITEICEQINKQIQNINSRVLVFVREIDFTFYLVDILTKFTEAEAIVGNSAKTELKVHDDQMQVLSRFHNGTTKVLVATTVVEEGLDVAMCNMVISYGHVTNEISMVQRMGRLRATNSKYILVLPPMLHWLEKKEKVNEHRRNMMMKLIEEFEKGDPNERRLKIEAFQSQYYSETGNKINVAVENKQWKFTCKNCQAFICTSDDVRLLDGCHRICMIPELLDKFKIHEKEKEKSYGAQKSYKNAGKVFCFQCNNHQLGSYVYYRENPFFQLKIDSCNTTNSEGLMIHFKSWKTFEVSLKSLSSAEFEMYCSQLNALTNNI